MKLTEQQIADNAAAVAAHLNGNPIERISFEYPAYGYRPCNSPEWKFDQGAYRPAPEPEPPKPWDCADDVPGPVCWIREVGSGGASLVCGVSEGGIWIVSRASDPQMLWCDISDWEYSTDRKTWKPCVKEAK